MVVKLKDKTLLFDNYCWHEYVKRVDWENISGSSNQSAIYAGIASFAYSEGLEKPSWKEVGEFVRGLKPEDMEKVKDAFEAMNEYKAFVEKVHGEVAALTAAETKKKQTKASKKILK